MSEQVEWFESWFDSPYYHILYKDRGHEEAEGFINKIVSHYNLSEHSKVLDLACGKGRHSVSFSNYGCQVVGMDLSEKSIEFAKISETEKLRFLKHDMRNEFPEQTFSFIANLFTSIGYFEKEEDNILTLKNIYSSLADSGVCLIDFMNTPKVKKELVEAEIKTVDGIKFKISRGIKNGWICKLIQFNVDGKPYKFEERVQALSQEKFKSFFDAAGLKLNNIYGDYSLSIYDEKQSPRMIFEITK